jgi:outer membrane protein TolC
MALISGRAHADVPRFSSSTPATTTTSTPATKTTSTSTPATPEQSAANLLDIAKQGYDTATKLFQAGAGTLTTLTEWSGRLREAEVLNAKTPEARQAADAAHLERMRKIEALVKASYEHGVVSSLDMLDARYQTVQAERRLAEDTTKH